MSLTDAELDRLCVVLVRARDPNNIGAVARTMYDFGFRDLRLVNEYTVPFERLGRRLQGRRYDARQANISR
jgi:tRNA C32,U32 (ribose-2'-O)-methylase TrmJ